MMRVWRFVVHDRGIPDAAAAMGGWGRWEAAVNHETFLRDLHAARDRAGQLRLQAGGQGSGEPALSLALAELDVALEELQVAEEEVRAQREALDDGHDSSQAERQRYQALFQLAPAPYLVTDPLGVVLDANQRATGLLRVGGRSVVGEPLASFGAGLMLADQAGHLRWVTATGEAEQAFERAQRDLGEGPCVDAFDRGQVVRTFDLRTEPRWPRLAPAATGNHIRGVLAVPVGLAGSVLGTINAVAYEPRAWTDDAGAIIVLAAVTRAAAGLDQRGPPPGRPGRPAAGALDSRVLVEQAKGLLMEREGLSEHAAFERLRRRARARSRRIDDVARQVIADRGPHQR
jgi:PAS domain-containing protein